LIDFRPAPNLQIYFKDQEQPMFHRLRPYFRVLSALAATWLLTILSGPATAQVTITENFTQNGGIFDGDTDTFMLNNLVVVSHDQNNPLFTLTNGAGTINLEATVIGGSAGESGGLLVENASWLTQDYAFGGNWMGSVGGHVIYTGNAYLGLGLGSSGTATVTGADSRWRDVGGWGGLVVGYLGSGTLNVLDGGLVDGFWSASIGSFAQGEVTVSGVSGGYRSTLNTQYILSVGNDSFYDDSAGMLNILDGGLVASSIWGSYIDGTGLAFVNGVNGADRSTWHAGPSLEVVGGGLTIDNGGLAVSGNGTVGSDSLGKTGVVSVKGSNGIHRSTWDAGHSLVVGANYWSTGSGILNVEDGGLVTAGTWGSFIGRFDNEHGETNVTGAGSELRIGNPVDHVNWGGDLILGGTSLVDASTATGELNVSNGGSVFVGDTLRIHDGGTVNLQSGGTIETYNLDPTDGIFNFTGGTLILAGGEFTGSLSLPEVGTLTGTGTINGDLLNAGIVAPGNSPGLLTVSGDYTQTFSGVLEVELAGLLAGIEFDQLDVFGNATLAGLLSVAVDPGFDLELGQTFDILTVGGVLNGSFANFMDNDLILTFDGGGLFINYHSNGVSLFTAVPEPSAAALVAVGLLGCMHSRRRKKQRV
jgi:fibronectin-binding autotransporter adhesin